MDLKLRPSFFFSFLIFIFLLKKPDLGSASSPKCISTERQALLTFKQSLTDPSGRLSSWSGPDCCRWRGVGCNRRTSHVIKIDIRNPNQTLRPYDYWDVYDMGALGGKINPSLTRLKFLSYLDLSSNDFNFTAIPEFIGNMVSLRYLNLSFSSFHGEVPASLGNLSKLQSLDLYAQTFIDDGPFSSTLYTLRASNLGWLSGLSSSLTYLNMGVVNMRGVSETWFEDFSKLSKLKELHLFNCLLEKLPLSLPSSANLKLLEVLDLSANSLRSPIPAFLGDLPQLKYLDLSMNSLEGQIHRFLDALSKNKGKSLVYLALNYNRLNGTLPESLGALRNLQILEVVGNSFTGSIPSSVGNLVSLKKLVLRFNSI